MLINRTALAGLYTGFSAAFQSGFAGVEPMYGRVAMTVPSTTRTNEYGWLGQMPRIREWIGDRVVNSIETYGYALRNKPFEMTIGVDRDDIDDDNLGIYTPLFSEMGNAAATFPDELVWPLLKAGFTTPCYDGQYFFDTDHPVLDENGVAVSVSNTGGGAGTPWFLLDVSRVIKPVIWQTRKPFDNLIRKDRETDDNVFDRKEYVYGVDGRCNVGFSFWQIAYGSRQALDALSYEAARVAMGDLKGDYGRPLGVKPRLLVVPHSLEGAARRIVGNQLINGGQTNEWYGTAEVMVVPWLA